MTACRITRPVLARASLVAVGTPKARGARIAVGAGPSRRAGTAAVGAVAGAVNATRARLIAVGAPITGGARIAVGAGPTCRAGARNCTVNALVARAVAARRA